jgi:GYF domain 2
MGADWWYSDRFGQVGPFTLEQLRDVLSTFDERRTSEVLVWCQGFSEWKAPDILNDFREQDDVLPSQKSGASWLLAQATDAIIGAGKSYWSRLANEFLRDKRDRMWAKALRPTPTAAERVWAGAFLFIVGTFGALLLIGLILPKDQTRVTPIPPPRDWRAQEGDVCALDWRGRGLPEEDIRYLRKGC